MNTFLGVDGGGTKTEFVLIDESGRVLSIHREGPAYHLETGMDALRAMLASGIRATLRQGQVPPEALTFAFLGLPAHGEDSRRQGLLDEAASPLLPRERFRCGNDMICGWAGALAGRDGINLVAGTGSIAYGEFAGRNARAGGWGEVFGDEGSAYWVAREALALFSRMSDGRAPQAPLYDLIRERFRLCSDLDLCAAAYGPPPMTRSELAGLAPIVARAAGAGDLQAQRVFEAAARELAALVHAVRDQLRPPPGLPMPVSYSGGMFQFGELILEPLRSAIGVNGRQYEFSAPKMTPGAGAALYAARLGGTPLAATAIAALTRQLAAARPGAASA